MNLEELRTKLKKNDFYLSGELAYAFGVSRVTIQRAAKKHGIGVLTRRHNGARGVRLYRDEDLKKLCKVIQNERQGSEKKTKQESSSVWKPSARRTD